MSAFTIVPVSMLLDGDPNEGSVKTAVGIVESASDHGIRRPRFLIRLAGHEQVFTFVGPSEVKRELATVVKPGVVARLGHADERVGWNRDRIPVYAVTVDDRPIHTFAQYVEYRRKDKRLTFWFAFLPSLASVGFFAWGFRRQRRKQVHNQPQQRTGDEGIL